jgi:hypothetical protein
VVSALRGQRPVERFFVMWRLWAPGASSSSEASEGQLGGSWRRLAHAATAEWLMSVKGEVAPNVRRSTSFCRCLYGSTVRTGRLWHVIVDSCHRHSALRLPASYL